MTLTTGMDALRTARQCCTPECFGYHATWRLFRRAGLKGTPAWHTGFYRTALTRWQPPAGGRIRVLVAGAADETVLRVLEALLGTRRLEVHLVDACPTPLHLAQAYAYWSGLLLEPRQDRAPELATCHSPFDLIVTDGLLSLLHTPAHRAATVRRFAELLTDEGMLLYTTRIAGRAGVLEYDRLGRHLTAAAAAATWPGSPRARLRLAQHLRTRRSRAAPFASPGDLAAAVAGDFGQVRLHTRRAAHTVPIALAPSVLAGHGSTSVGIAATAPAPGGRP